jgi:hypothetical protein
MLIPLLQHLGPRWLAQRARFALEKKSGWLAAKTPCLPWTGYGFRGDLASASATWRQDAPTLPVNALKLDAMKSWLATQSGQTRSTVIQEAQALLQGQLRFFSGHLAEVGSPPRWFKNVLTGTEYANAVHWTKIYDHPGEDIKGVWEASRFAWALTLARAWLHTGDEVYVNTFWAWVEDWMAHNPPNRGPNWGCGQEAALRLIAFTWALQVFRHHPRSRPELAAQLAEATAKRIEAHLSYALSQHNNHGISEAIGLLTAGTFWPNLPRAEAWRKQGLETLTQQVQALVARDGSFSQHSSNYHRLLVQLLIWAELTQKAQGKSLPKEVKELAKAATTFLRNLTLADGTVPRYGGDDGANLFLLSDTGYHDFRATLAPALALFSEEGCEPGPWSEASFLLLGKVISGTRPVAPSFSAGGVTLYRQGDDALFFRHPNQFRHRPAHADQLHVSLRYKGNWIAEDLGTYSYNDTRYHGDGWSAARFHNVVTVNGLDPMHRRGRFLWLPWTVCHDYPNSKGEQQTAAYYDGLEGGRIARAVLKLTDGFVVVDRVTHSIPVAAILRWHGREKGGLETLQVFCSAASKEHWLTTEPVSDLGWYSEFYGTRTPSWVRTYEAEGKVIYFITALTPSQVSIDWTQGIFKVGNEVYSLNQDFRVSPLSN